ncbi:phage terminase large subunit [Actinomadura litoris]|uniref:phage terminase large subunit n=1 Tax=Actinomadura litoris TaxID=2678616 RepID=UPI001FA79D8D|nr:phage terminase large subunit [Actinomadura litoris]
MTIALDPVQGVAQAILNHFAPVDARRWDTPGALARELDPRTVQTPALTIIDQALVDIGEGRGNRLMISVPPQEGKSVRISRRFPEWLLNRNPDLRLAIVSYAHGVARRHGRAIRDDIAAHSSTLGLAVNPASSAAHEWEVDGREGGVYCVGIKGSLTSRPVDGLIIDDPYKDGEQADSDAWTETVRDFWTEVAIPRLGPGSFVVIVQTRWRHDDLTGWLQAEDHARRWRVINIPAQADHDPAKGETDILGRQPGEYLKSARGRSIQEWETKKLEVGSRTWNALYQGRPTPGEGGIFQRGWWREYSSPRWIVRDDGAHIVPGADEVIQSWDMAFKSTDGSDFVVGQVWGRWGLEAFLLDQVCERLPFVETCAALRQLAAKWPQATAKYVEDKANGTAVINALSRTVPGLIPVEPDGSKEARASAVSPFVEAGSVHLPSPELAPWVGAYIEEHAAFPRASHDDQVDATSQALNRLLLNPILTGETILGAEDFDDDLDDREISPY